MKMAKLILTPWEKICVRDSLHFNRKEILKLVKAQEKARTSEASKAIFLDEARALMDLYSTFYSLAVFGENRDIFEIKFNVNVFEDFMKNIQAEDGLHE